MPIAYLERQLGANKNKQKNGALQDIASRGESQGLIISPAMREDDARTGQVPTSRDDKSQKEIRPDERTGRESTKIKSQQATQCGTKLQENNRSRGLRGVSADQRRV